MNFLHTFSPDPILISVGPITIYWYGFFIMLAVLAGLVMSLWVGQWYKIKKEIIFDLFFYLVISGIIGARIFYVLYNPEYFWQNPLDIFKIWQGGLAIHGAWVGGIIALWWFCRRLSLRAKPASLAKRGERGNPVSSSTSTHRNTDIAVPAGLPRPDITFGVIRTRNDSVFWKITIIIVPGIALGQAIGRWGNYFNQELFGKPTDLPWGIPIELINRPGGYEMFEYFHPTFLYESIGCLVIFGILMLGHWIILKKNFTTYNLQLTTLGYFLLYSILRFFVEFLRIDEVLMVFGMRATQLISLMIIVGCVGFMIYKIKSPRDSGLSPG